MQIPKIMGGKSGSGELPELLKHLYETAQHINWVSVALGVGALAILIISKKVMPKFPMAVVIMALGMIATMVFHVDRYGVTLLAKVEPGLPKFILPDIFHLDLSHAAGRGLMIAAACKRRDNISCCTGQNFFIIINFVTIFCCKIILRKQSFGHNNNCNHQASACRVA